MKRHHFAGLFLSPAGTKGLGVFAERRFPRGAVVLRFEGPRLHRRRVRDFSHTIQVGTSTFLGPSGGLDDYVNHSCEPNCGLRTYGESLELFALRSILPLQEITFDYSTCMVDEPTIAPCDCRTRRCRGAVDPFPHLAPKLQARYASLGAVPDFAQESVRHEDLVAPAGNEGTVVV